MLYVIVLTATVVILWLGSMLVWPLVSSEGGDFGFGLFFTFVDFGARTGVAVVVWLVAMLVWAIWFRGPQ